MHETKSVNNGNGPATGYTDQAVTDARAVSVTFWDLV
jgi:hypothetical protein